MPLALISVAAAMALVGCSGKSTTETPAEKALVRQDHVARVGSDTPRGIVLQLWRAVQVGDLPSAAAFYHPKVRRELGFETITGVLGPQRSSLAVLTPKIASVQRTPIGIEVIVRATSGGSGVGVQSFLLRRDAARWRVAYDTLLGDGLSSYVQAQVQSQVSPASDTPSPAAQRAAQRLSTIYRTLFSDSLDPATVSDRPRGTVP